MIRSAYITLIALTLMISGCGKLKKSSNAPADANAGPLKPKEAFTKFLHPVLRSYCKDCHTNGAHPFASLDMDEAMLSASGKIGTNLEDSRFHLKLRDEKHPNLQISATALPEVKNALLKYYESIANAVDQAYILSNEVDFSQAQQRYPSIDSFKPNLIIEAEGMSLAGNFKYDTTGGASNSFAVIAKTFPSHADGSPRSYFATFCSSINPSVTITQPAHTASDILKRSYVRRYILRDGVDGVDLLSFGRRLEFDAAPFLPQNYDPMNTPIPDSIYETPYNPSTAVLTDTQLNSLLARLYDEYLRLNPSERSSRLNELMIEIIQNVHANPSSLLGYLRQVDSRSTSVQFRVDNRAVNLVDVGAGYALNNLKIDNISRSIQLHEPQSLNPANFPSSVTTPGTAQFRFFAPSTTDVLVSPLFRSSGNFYYRIKSLATNEYLKTQLLDSQGNIIREDNQTCFLRTNTSLDNGWSAVSTQGFKLKAGEEYIFEVMQRDGATLVDSIMLSGRGALLPLVNPNEDPTVLRSPIYGIDAGGIQQKVSYLRFEFSPGFLEMEVFKRDKHLELRAPKFYLSSSKDKSIFMNGFDFLVDQNEVLTNKSFSISEARPSGAMVVYTRALLPFEDASSRIIARFLELKPSLDPGKLAEYLDRPPNTELVCKNPTAFRDLIWPLYSQQLVAETADYHSWADSSDYFRTPPELRAFREYTCQGCHNGSHPLFPIPSDYISACNEVLRRTNLQYPALSFSLRGILGQFGHPPIYPIMNPFDGNENLRKAANANNVQVIYGDYLGKILSYDAQDQDLARAAGLSEAQVLRSILRYTYSLDSVTGDPIRVSNGQPLGFEKVLPQDQLYSTRSIMYRGSSSANIATQADIVRNLWFKKFQEWVNIEKAAQSSSP